jgi:hypothetical protein
VAVLLLLAFGLAFAFLALRAGGAEGGSFRRGVVAMGGGLLYTFWLGEPSRTGKRVQ